MNKTKSLKALLATPGLIIAPGAYDAITARLIAQAGFPAVYMTGAGVAASRGYPDYGLVTMSEMADSASIMARSVSIPVIADGDTGYGNELNITRTIREYEQRGVAAIQLEDQVAPKRCGHLDSKEIVSRQEFVSKILAAVRARTNPEFAIIARTDARAVSGLDEAIDRANAALDVGADIVFVEAPQTMSEIEVIPKRVAGPCLLNVVPGGKTPMRNLLDVAELGYRLAILPGALLFNIVASSEAILRALGSSMSHPPLPPGLSIADMFKRFGAQEWDALRNYHQSAFMEQANGKNPV
jgi:2-methylisocitrate lyase-like PEP mutase family enzyme